MEKNYKTEVRKAAETAMLKEQHKFLSELSRKQVVLRKKSMLLSVIFCCMAKHWKVFKKENHHLIDDNLVALEGQLPITFR